MKSHVTETTYGRRITLGIAGLLLIGLFAASISQLFTSYLQVEAAPATTYNTVDLSDPWIPSRGVVSGGHIASSSSLEMRVDNTNADPTPSPDPSRPDYYQTEGLQKDFSDRDSIRASLFIDPDWQTKPVDVNMYGIVYSPNHSDPGWPIIGFTTLGGYTGFRVYDTRGGASPAWYELPSVNFSWGETYALEIAYNATTEHYDFYVNDSLAQSLPASRGGGAPRGIFRGVTFTTYNSNTGDNTDNYTARWTGLQTGTTTDAPAPAPGVVPGVPNTGRL